MLPVRSGMQRGRPTRGIQPGALLALRRWQTTEQKLAALLWACLYTVSCGSKCRPHMWVIVRTLDSMMVVLVIMDL